MIICTKDINTCQCDECCENRDQYAQIEAEQEIERAMERFWIEGPRPAYYDDRENR